MQSRYEAYSRGVRYLDHSINLNVNDMFSEVLHATKITMIDAEKRQFLINIYVQCIW